MPTRSLQLCACIILTSLAITVSAQDIREKVASPPGVAKASEMIDPDSGIYGIPFGTTEDQFIAQFGNPMGYVRLPGGMTGMIYGKTHCFLFAGGQLAGLRITRAVLDWRLTESIAPSTMFDSINWRFRNGITKDMTLVQIRQILGDELNEERFRQAFVTQRSKVALDFMYSGCENADAETAKLCGILITPR